MGDPKVNSKRLYSIDADNYGFLCSPDQLVEHFLCKEDHQLLDKFTLGSLYKHIISLGYPDYGKSLTVSIFRDFFKLSSNSHIDPTGAVIKSMQCWLDEGIVDKVVDDLKYFNVDNGLSELTPHTLRRLTAIFEEHYSLHSGCRDPEALQNLSFAMLSKPEPVAQLIKQFGNSFVKFLHVIITSPKINPNQYPHMGDALVYLIEHHPDKISTTMLKDILAFEQRIEHLELRETLYGNEVDAPSPILKEAFAHYHAQIKDPEDYGEIDYPKLLSLALQRGHPDAVAEMRNIILKDTHHVLAAREPDSAVVWTFLKATDTQHILPHLKDAYQAVSRDVRYQLPELLRQPSMHTIELLILLSRDQSGAKHLQAVETEYRARFTDEDLTKYQPLNLLDYSQFIAQQTASQYLPYKESEKHEMKLEYHMMGKMENADPLSRGSREMKRYMYDKDLRRTDFHPSRWMHFLGEWSQRDSLDSLPSAGNALEAVFHLVNHPCIATFDALQTLAWQQNAYENDQQILQYKIDEAHQTEINLQKISRAEWYSYGYTDEDFAKRRAEIKVALQSIPQWKQEIARLKKQQEQMTARVLQFFDRELDVGQLSSYLRKAEAPSNLELSRLVHTALEKFISNHQEPGRLYEVAVFLAMKAKDPAVAAEMIDLLKMAEQKHAYVNHNTPPHQELKALALREGKVGDYAWNALKEVIVSYWNGSETLAPGDVAPTNEVPDKSPAYIRNLVDIATTSQSHAVDATNMLLNRFEATKDILLFETLQNLDTSALQAMLPPIGNDSSLELDTPHALATIRQLALLRNTGAITILTSRFAAGDTALTKDMEDMLHRPAFADVHRQIVEAATRLCTEQLATDVMESGWNVVRVACEENIPDAWNTVKNLYFTFAETGDTNQAEQTIWTVLNLEAEPSPDHAMAIATLDQELATWVGYPETVDDEIDPRFTGYLVEPHGANLGELAQAVSDFEAERERLITEQRLTANLTGADPSTTTSAVRSEGSTAHSVGNVPQSSFGLSTTSSGAVGSPTSPSAANPSESRSGITAYSSATTGNETVTQISASEASATSGWMVFASPAQILEASYVAVLTTGISKNEKQQYLDVMGNIAMNVLPLQSEALQHIEDIVLTSTNIEMPVKVYALNMLLTIANSGSATAEQGLYTLIDDAYQLAYNGSQWEHHVLEMIAKNGGHQYSKRAYKRLEQLDE